MRKITYFFAVVLTLIFLFSCANGCDKKEHSHLSEWKHDELTHWLVVTCSTSECDFNMPPPAAHVDGDDDGKCDVCGYVIPKHEHTYSNYSDEIGHGWSYTCGCKTPPNFAQHADGDDNGKCDACGYDIPEHEHTGEWHTSEYTHYYQYTCGCPSPDIAELHSDYDENFICDICGYVMNEHEHTYAYNHDNIGHGWSYTCGCMTPPNFAQHFDGDGDGKCDEDSCGYDMSECQP